MINIGYACLALGVPNSGIKSCIMKNATDEKLKELISHNLASLENLVDYNIHNNIRMFRISSDIIPFASSPVNKLEWWNLFQADFDRIGRKIGDSGMRISMHPGQYTVLNSPDEGVVERAVLDLQYHSRFLDCLGATSRNKIILHLGGVYGDMESAVKRFADNYKNLDQGIKEKLVLENDDRSYDICKVLETAEPLGIPVVYDNLHNEVKGCGSSEHRMWIKECSRTWSSSDGRQKIHYSQQNQDKQPGAHTITIAIDEFMKFHESVKDLNIDIMLEVKDKNVSAIKCINCISSDEAKGSLQRDWARYKYLMMEKSQECYDKSRQLFNDYEYPSLEFYKLTESCMELTEKTGQAVNAAEHVWGYFKETASEQEKNRFFKLLDGYREGNVKLASVKRSLYRLAKKYDSRYLQESYYFVGI